MADRIITALREGSFRYGDFVPGVLQKGPVQRGDEAVRGAYRGLRWQVALNRAPGASGFSRP